MNYEKLNTDLKTIKPGCEEHKMIQKFLTNTQDTRKLELMHAYAVNRKDKTKPFNPNKIGNKQLLWHGSRFSNYVGILSQGLRIAPPEAPRTGYLYGKGIYFATMASKSAPYCCPNLSNNIGIFILAEVAVGKSRNLYDTDSNADFNLPKDCNSTRCIGRRTPDPSDFKTIDKDINVPYGKVITSHDTKALRQDDEIIVYNV